MAKTAKNPWFSGIKFATNVIEYSKPSGGTIPKRYTEKIHGTIRMGEMVTVITEEERKIGRVIYIHPKGRFFTMETDEGLKESFLIPKV